MKCTYIKYISEECGEESNNLFCIKHKDVFCACGKQAIGMCIRQEGTYPCGFPTCGEHYPQKGSLYCPRHES